MERVAEFESASSARKAEVLPLNDTRRQIKKNYALKNIYYTNLRSTCNILQLYSVTETINLCHKQRLSDIFTVVLTTFALTGLFTRTFHRQFSKIIYIFFLPIQNWPSATRMLCAYVIHKFLCFTAKRIVGISKVQYGNQPHPNLDSALALNKSFYYSAHTLTTFNCEYSSAAPWFGLPTSPTYESLHI